MKLSSANPKVPLPVTGLPAMETIDFAFVLIFSFLFSYLVVSYPRQADHPTSLSPMCTTFSSAPM